MKNEELISCLCVTHNRVPHLARAIGCYQQQTHSLRELLVVHLESDEATRSYLASLDDPTIHAVAMSGAPSLGKQRNTSLELARGKYVAIWDDDDWHAPTRLAEQAAAIHSSGAAGCALIRLTLYDQRMRRAYLSHRRAWEGTLVAQRDQIPWYPDLPKGEDTPVLRELLASGRLFPLHRPELYVYVFHGGNTCQPSHWDNILLPAAEPLSQEVTAEVERWLGVVNP